MKTPAEIIPVKVESVIFADYDSLHGRLERCNVRLTNGVAMTAWLARLPETVPAYLQKEQALTQDIAGLTRQIETGTAQLDAGAADQCPGGAGGSAEQQVGQSVMLMPSVVYDGMFATPGFDVFSVNAARRSLTGASNELANVRAQVTDLRASRDSLQSELDQMKNGEPAALTVMVLVSHFPHYGGQVWVFALRSPPKPAK